MTKFERLYQEYRDAYEARRNATTKEEKELAWEKMDEFDTKFDGESRAFIEAWRDYRNSMDMGYKYLDCENPSRDATEYAKVLKDNGIKKFTFSSTWSGAVEDAWKFQSAGYRIEGVTKAPKTAFVFTAE